MRRYALIALVIAFFLSRLNWTAVPTAELPGRVSGTFVRGDAKSLTLQPTGAPGRKLPEQVIAIGPGTKVMREEVDVGGVRAVPATLSQVGAGARIVVTVRGQAAGEVRILAPPPISGTVVAADGRLMVIRTVLSAAMHLTADESFAIDPQRTQVSRTRLRYGPTKRVDVASLRPGDSVIVLAKDHLAFVVDVQPQVPITGGLSHVTDQDIGIRPITRPGSPPAAEQDFRVDRARTELFHEYVGEPPETAQWSDLELGKLVAVTTEDGVAATITLVHPAVHGKLNAIGQGWITVVCEGAARGAAALKFTIGPRSRIELGHELRASKLRSGKTLHVWRYIPGAALSELKVGEPVAITAKGNLVLSMRVTPVPAAATRPIASR